MVVLACGKRNRGLGALGRKIARQAAHQRMERATGEESVCTSVSRPMRRTKAQAEASRP